MITVTTDKNVTINVYEDSIILKDKEFKALMSCKSAWVEFETDRANFNLGISDDWQYAYNIIAPLKIYKIVDDSQYEVLKEEIDVFFKYDGCNWNKEEDYDYNTLDYFLSELHPLLDKCLNY